MTKKPAISPRKRPKQTRSQSLVDSALEAAARILSSLGYDAASTNRVAETAGISIGSLYQYFPNKDALIGAVIDRTIEEFMKRLEKDFEGHAELSVEQGIEVVTRRLVTSYMGKRKLLSVVFEQVSRVQRMKNILHARRHGARLVKASFERNRDRIHVADVDRASYIVVNAVMGVMLTAIVDEALPLNETQLADELIDLVKGYLLWDRSGA
jgi:AcrR family transcriptional regulator